MERGHNYEEMLPPHAVIALDPSRLHKPSNFMKPELQLIENRRLSHRDHRGFLSSDTCRLFWSGADGSGKEKTDRLGSATSPRLLELLLSLFIMDSNNCSAIRRVELEAARCSLWLTDTRHSPKTLSKLNANGDKYPSAFCHCGTGSVHRTRGPEGRRRSETWF